MHARNAAIWYASDGYEPESKGINGRRVAGASFLKGFLRHGDVDEFVSVSQSNRGHAAFAAALAQTRPEITHRAVHTSQLARLAPVGALYFPSPNFAQQCWQRQAYGMARYSICGITHTTATQGVMRGVFDLRAGPQAEWDGIICTSRAVQQSMLRNMEIADDFLRARFGHVPPRPQLPVIPLGIHCDEFAHDAPARAALRNRMGWGDDDIAIVTLSRLLPYGKFDPGPVFLALEQAQARLGQTKRLHFLACGTFSDNYSEKVFRDCAAKLMPSVSFEHLPGDDPQARKETLSAGDIFVFPIDNIQETFGLAPIEAMAAGLPVITSDWDGMRDTISHDVGIRVPTTSTSAAASRPEALGYLSEDLSYGQYGNRLSMMTAIDLPKLVEAVGQLASDKALRDKMGQAGVARARRLYDWRAIIPQMQDFWAELTTIRETQLGPSQDARHNPVGPLPMDLFRSYPSQTLGHGQTRLIAAGTPEQLDVIFAARAYDKLGQPAEKQTTFEALLRALSRHGDQGASLSELSEELGLNPLSVERGCAFLLKYGLAARKDP
ncbi:MAG: glycosyltransferase family 4 protein [Mangrovicoccus sp.]|nr:glycosyltransferase family 4 protein [Mangrovicoccus sp.]